MLTRAECPRFLMSFCTLCGSSQVYYKSMLDQFGLNMLAHLHIVTHCITLYHPVLSCIQDVESRMDSEDVSNPFEEVRTFTEFRASRVWMGMDSHVIN